jgi:site-specific recombinase XerD
MVRGWVEKHSWRLIDELSSSAGITKKMSPHRVRHSSITTVLDKAGRELPRDTTVQSSQEN